MARPIPYTASAFCILALTLCLHGCPGSGPSTSDPQPDFPQAPVLETETVSVFFEGDETNYDEADPEASTIEQGLVGEEARTLSPLKTGLNLANSMMLPAVAYLGGIMSQEEPVLRDSSRIVWEVRRDGVITSLVVSVAEPGSSAWTYQLALRRASEEPGTGRTLISGFFESGGRASNGRQTGVGRMRVDYDAIAPFLAPDKRSSGVASFGFRTLPASKHLFMHFESFIPPRSDDVINGRFQYIQRDQGISEFRYILFDDFVTWLPGDEAWSSTARWTPERSGRTRAVLSSTTQPDVSLELQECWDINLRQTWTQWAPTVPNGEANDGDRANCPSALRATPPPLPDERPVEAGEEAPVPDEG